MILDSPGVGEIVIEQRYFDEHLAEDYEHPRNVVSGAVSAKELSADAQRALESGAIRFINFNSLHNIVCTGAMLVEMLDEFVERILSDVGYKTDGVIIEVTNEAVKEHMGSTSHHHRWMIAKKSRGESAVTSVTGIRWTTGRTGRITPTVLIDPVRLSGATLSKVVAHHAGNVQSKGIGIGAQLRIIRSGEVIPFIDEVVDRAEGVEIPDQCPSCESPVRWDNDFIVCTSLECDAQCARRLHHFFEILGNLDLFGTKAVETLVENGHRDLVSIYKLTAADFAACGFGPKQSENLVNELIRSRTDAVEDWRFLGALGIPHLGRGSSRRLLKIHSIETLNKVTAAEIEKIDSFGQVVAPSVHADINVLWPVISGLLGLGFNLVTSIAPAGGPLSGKRVVFTGTMPKPRKEMESQAESLGAVVQSSVSKTTNWLVTGERVGKTKINKAVSLGVEVISVSDYEAKISD